MSLVRYCDFKDINKLPPYRVIDLRDDFIQSFWSDYKNIFSSDNKYGQAIGNTIYQTMLIGGLGYHSPYHIMNLFCVANSLGIELTADEKLAIWFHDVIYRPGSKENESQSITFMMALLHNIADINIMHGASLIIEDTANHLEKNPEYEQSKLVMDLDMSGFGADPESYKIQNDAIEQEFLNYGLTELQVLTGRLSFLEKLNSKDTIYRTDLFKDKFEYKARVNLVGLIEETKGRLSNIS